MRLIGDSAILADSREWLESPLSGLRWLPISERKLDSLAHSSGARWVGGLTESALGTDNGLGPCCRIFFGCTDAFEAIAGTRGSLIPLLGGGTLFRFNSLVSSSGLKLYNFFFLIGLYPGGTISSPEFLVVAFMYCC